MSQCVHICGVFIGYRLYGVNVLWKVVKVLLLK